MIKGTTDLFETLAKASKPLPFQNLTEEQAQEICDVLYKSSIEAAINSLQIGYVLAKKMNNILLADLISKDIDTYMDMFNKRQLASFGKVIKGEPFVYKENHNG